MSTLAVSVATLQRVPLFEGVAREYDAARPWYPPGVFDALEPLAGLTVLDVGAGAGIATRALLDRAASVVAIDHSHEMLRRAAIRSPDLRAVVADGHTLPIHTASIDLVCFAQAWHWLDAGAGASEVHRVLRPDGRFAAWWSHARADGEEWFDAYWTAVSRACAGVSRDQRDTDWGTTMAGDWRFDVATRVTIGWDRTMTVDQFMTEVASYSYIAALAPAARRDLLADLDNIVRRRFDGPMLVPYESWLWIATPHRAEARALADPEFCRRSERRETR